MVNIKFSNPKRSPVVIFDNTGSEVLERMVLSGIDHAILHSRYEVLYITPSILVQVLKNIRYVNRMRHGKRWGWGCLYRVYLLSCIEYMQPKAVITFVDNSYSFQLISRMYKNAQFIAIQNGDRARLNLKDSLPPFPQPGSIISMPALICFGKHYIDLFKKYNHQIDSYYPLGSLRARYYKAFLSKARPAREFDLCLISEWDENIIAGRYLPDFGKGVMAIDNFLNRYVKEEKKALCIALRSSNSKEEEYFLSTYGPQVTLIKSNRELMSSYDAIDRSTVAVSLFSTLAFEAFGWGAKVLFCNFTGDDQFDFPRPGFWSMNEPVYEQFKEKLNYMMAMGPDEYQRQTKEGAAHVMNNEAKPPQEFIRELISNLAPSGKSSS